MDEIKYFNHIKLRYYEGKNVLLTHYDNKNSIRIAVVWEHNGVRICFQDDQAIIVNATKELRPLCEPLKRPNIAFFGPVS